ncbi:MAG TPA: class I SAM-dependent methyltransferase [Chitinophagaceae bacterium]|jgi:ubiquinone/menaquinone biosynthesis C-methylase UbiE|nr:class I SAM-dependent methyltransferase [Chitinophagaceae bacterium]
MPVKEYDPQHYWDDVAQHIGSRDDNNIIAGDDEPYYRYKRKMFLKLLDRIDFTNKKVLEVGPGPGGNLHYLLQKNCKEIAGADISEQMIELAKKNLQEPTIAIHKTDGFTLSFTDNYFDLVFTSTVLQHVTDENQLQQLIKSICRVSASEVIIFERIENKITGHESNLGRPISYYADIFKSNGFILYTTRFLPVRASYIVCGAIRKLFNPKSRKEGEPISKTSRMLQTIALPVTKVLDKIIPAKSDLCMLYFKKDH